MEMIWDKKFTTECQVCGKTITFELMEEFSDDTLRQFTTECKNCDTDFSYDFYISLTRGGFL